MSRETKCLCFEKHWIGEAGHAHIVQIRGESYRLKDKKMAGTAPISASSQDLLTNT